MTSPELFRFNKSSIKNGDMERFTVIATLCFVVLSRKATLTDGATVSPEIFTPSELSALHQMTLDVNVTELSLALRADHPHAHLTAVEVIRLYDYKVEIHTVKTSDNYFLELHRITGNKKYPSPAGKRAVLLQHGLLCSSMDWVLAGPKRGFAFILADAGYDVWLGNVRGSKYSRQHEYLNVTEPKYWDFDWHEIGLYDLPAMIDHITAVTGREKIYYVGHSQGSTAFFVMTSELPHYNQKINAMFSLAPVAYCSRMFSPVFQALARLIEPIDLLTNLIGVYEFKPSDSFFKKFATLICQEESITHPLCMNVLFMFTGFNWKQFDTSLLPAILAHVPAGAGVNQFVHYAQIIKSGHFRQFDLNMWGNLLRYHSIKPPSYNLKNIVAPVSLHYSVNDWLSDPKDVEKLLSKLPNPIGKFRVVDDKFNHLDYLWAKDVKVLLYNKIMSIMQRYKD